MIIKVDFTNLIEGFTEDETTHTLVEEGNKWIWTPRKQIHAVAALQFVCWGIY